MFYLIKFKILIYLYFFYHLIWYVKYKNEILLKILINIKIIIYDVIDWIISEWIGNFFVSNHWSDFKNIVYF